MVQTSEKASRNWKLICSRYHSQCYVCVCLRMCVSITKTVQCCNIIWNDSCNSMTIKLIIGFCWQHEMAREWYFSWVVYALPICEYCVSMENRAAGSQQATAWTTEQTVYTPNKWATKRNSTNEPTFANWSIQHWLLQQKMNLLCVSILR